MASPSSIPLQAGAGSGSGMPWVVAPWCPSPSTVAEVETKADMPSPTAPPSSPTVVSCTKEETTDEQIARELARREALMLSLEKTASRLQAVKMRECEKKAKRLRRLQTDEEIARCLREEEEAAEQAKERERRRKQVEKDAALAQAMFAEERAKLVEEAKKREQLRKVAEQVATDAAIAAAVAAEEVEKDAALAKALAGEK
jgi:hypothetical protein